MLTFQGCVLCRAVFCFPVCCAVILTLRDSWCLTATTWVGSSCPSSNSANMWGWTLPPFIPSECFPEARVSWVPIVFPSFSSVCTIYSFTLLPSLISAGKMGIFCRYDWPIFYHFLYVGSSENLCSWDTRSLLEFWIKASCFENEEFTKVAFISCIHMAMFSNAACFVAPPSVTISGFTELKRKVKYTSSNGR